ncbi:hypothetical protein GCM10007415_01540 [Parapedobacter pyrenivorans]|uniref:Uncharacterized protein n=1 Tax=Parapedobacter pyrenivorans TaxID=1305674 RepID=A0A917HC72_9SPHI|nr:hypothetical protein [Parapedobacter pyrenivorans]GGG73860.1 hypothetical protein GCM10007415_01540 [Parapedobacter pyrenivorans]
MDGNYMKSYLEQQITREGFVAFLTVDGKHMYVATEQDVVHLGDELFG